MARKLVVLVGAAALLGTIPASISGAGTDSRATRASCPKSYEPVLDQSHFVSVVDNQYFPLPVGRVLVYRGIKDGKTQVDTVTITAEVKKVEGIAATVVRDVATHNGKLLEKTSDWFAQDDHGNVWYLGEDTKEYLPDGTIDTSGSWEAGVHDAEPGLIMEADPQVPDGYRQECFTGEAMDTAWVVSRGGSLTVPFGTVHNVLRTLEFTQLEPNVVDQKYYAPGIGIVVEKTIAGGNEYAKLVSVQG
jgi:hypothetical protein